MTEGLRLPCEISLQERCFHALAKMCWGKFVLFSNNPKERKHFFKLKRKLIIHREKVIHNNLPHVLPETFSVIFHKQLKEKLIDAVIRLQQGYHAALFWEKKCQFSLPFTILDPVTAGEYQASCFIEPTGNFNDLSWAKRFVSDESQDVYYRFQIACLYCFEKSISNIWNFLKINDKLPYAGNLDLIKSEYDDMIVLWVFHLEDKFFELMEGDDRYTEGFYSSGFYSAIFGGHEYAAKFFWTCFSTTDKEECLRGFNFDYIGIAALLNENSGLIHFVYSLMTLERKKFLVLGRQKCAMAVIWSSLLVSDFFECALNDIMSFPYDIPLVCYLQIFYSLTLKIEEFGYPLHKWIFETLWNHISRETRKGILEKRACIIRSFVETKNIDLLELIIQPLSYPEKDKFLLEDWNRAGISALKEFSNQGEYDIMLRYLLLFFVSLDSVTQNLSARVDALSFLDKFNKNLLMYFNRKHISETVKLEINNVIDTLRGSLSVVSGILEEVENIYPTENIQLESKFW